MTERLRALRNLAWSSAATYVENALGILASVLIARTLGPTEYGFYAFAVWLSGWLLRGCNHALPITSIRFVAEARGRNDPDLALSISHLAFRLQQASSIAVLVIFAATALAVPPDEWREDLFLIVVLIVASVYSRAAFWMLGAIGKGFERFEVENLSLVLMAVLNTCMVVAWSLARGDWKDFLLTYLVSSIVLAASARYLARRHRVLPRQGHIPGETTSRMRRQFGLTAVIVLIGLVSGRAIETALLKAYSSPAAFAYFAIAGTLTKGAIDFVSSGLAAVLLPAMAKAYGGRGANGTAEITAEAVRYYWILGLAITSLGIVVAPGMVSLLYGTKYAEAIPAVVVSLVVAGLTTHSGALAALQNATERQADRLKIAVGTLAVNLALGLMLIPRFHLMGAVASSALTSLFHLAFAWYYVRRHVRVVAPLGIMARNAVAATLAAGAGLAATHLLSVSWGFIVGGLAFAVAYPFALLVLRCFRNVDFTMLGAVSSPLGTVGRHVSRFASACQARFSARD